MFYTEPYRNAVLLQRLMVDTAKSTESKPLERASCARAFVELEEMKRKIAMRPLPKAIDVSKAPGRGRRSRAKDASFEEPAGPVPTPEVAQSPAQPEPSKPK